MVKRSSLSRSTPMRAESLNLISLLLVKPKKSVLLSCYIGFLGLAGHCQMTSAALRYFFFLFKHFTNPLAASTTHVPWHWSAGRFVAYLMGLHWYPFFFLFFLKSHFEYWHQIYWNKRSQLWLPLWFKQHFTASNLSCSSNPWRSVVGQPQWLNSY